MSDAWKARRIYSRSDDTTHEGAHHAHHQEWPETFDQDAVTR